jgi:hypothetical protein
MMFKKYLYAGAVAVVIAAAFAGFAKLQSWKSAIREEGRVEVRIEWASATQVATEAAEETNRLNRKSKEKALENQKAELVKNAVVIERIRVVTVSLRDETSATVEAAGKDHVTCVSKVATLGELFGECRARLTEMGQAAQDHAIDVKALRESWPIK